MGLLRMLMAIIVLGLAMWAIFALSTLASSALFKNNEKPTLHATQRQLLSSPTLPNIQKDRMPRWYSYQDQQQ